MSLEMAQKVIVPKKKNYVPQFLKQRNINSYTDLGMKQILLAQCYNLQNICLHQFRIHI
jgi:hypothetical protein